MPTQFTSIYPDGAAAQAAGYGGAGGDANPDYPGMPVGATPIHHERTFAAPGTYDLWIPGSQRTAIVASAMISSDTAMRVAIVDNTDVEGSRIVDQYVAANGGSSPNLVPIPWPANLPGNVIRVVVAAAGNVKVRVSGWERAS